MDEAGRIKQQAIGRFPRGLIAQGALLDTARNETDPRRAAQILQDYLSRFDDNTSWTEIAARDRFLLIAKHRGGFSPDELIDAAAKWESRERAYIQEFGNPTRYLAATRQIARALMDHAPALSFSYAAKGAAFGAQEWANTKEFDANAQLTLWPFMLEAAVKLKRWPAAERLGQATLKEIEAGRLFEKPSEAAEEAKIRRLYATALEQSGKANEARWEFAIAESSARTADAKERRIEKLKADLLSAERKLPATRFRLKDLEGREVALEDYRGKALILAFWATWCGPCYGELAELNRLWDKFRDNPRAGLLTISIDDTVAVVTEFANRNAYRFPILKSDGTVESAYTNGIPQLYVLDPDGNIRFQVTGFENDGLFEQKLEWMIEAALAP